MSEVRTFFRFCPACGKRFHIRLVGKKLEGERTEQAMIKQDRGSVYGSAGMGGTGSTVPVIVEENIPLTIDVKDFQYSYKCKHCGHVWTEMHEEEEKI